MLFAEQFHEPIRRGLITLTVRRWKRPQARLGGIYRLYTGGFIEATEVEVIAPSQLDDADAIAAGYDSANELLEDLEGFEGDLYRIGFRYRGDLQDERALLAANGRAPVRIRDAADDARFQEALEPLSGASAAPARAPPSRGALTFLSPLSWSAH